MKVIIDTNILLNFYRLDGKQSMEMLDKLIELINSGKIELIIPWQIELEFLRNKNSDQIYGDHVINFEKKLTIDLQIPQVLKTSALAKQLKSSVKRLTDIRKKIVKEYESRVSKPNSKINQKIKKLFQLATRIREDDVVLQRAHYRTLRGSPPRKGNESFGDAIIWETILINCTTDDCVIISSDGDFASRLVSSQGDIHEILEREWTEHSSHSIELYTTLGKFINDNLPSNEKPIPNASIEQEKEFSSTSYAGGASLPIQDTIGSHLYALHDFGSSVATVGITVNSCSCCGRLISSSEVDLTLGGPRCRDCQDFSSVPKRCEKCGKHFHESIFRLSNDLFDGKTYCHNCRTV